MTDDHRLFRWLWRFNAVLIAGVGLIALATATVGAVALAVEFMRTPYTAQIVPAAETAEEDAGGASATLLIEDMVDLQPLGSTGLLYSRIMREHELENRMPRSYSSSKVSYSDIDWLIYDPGAGESRHLVGVRPSLLNDATMLQWRAPDAAKAQDLALLARYVVADSNEDGLLTASDDEVVALAAPDGTGLAPLDLKGELRSWEVISATEAVLLVKREKRSAIVHVDLTTRRITRESVLPEGPE